MKTGTDYPKRPNVEIVAKNKNTLELAWKPVGPDNTYIVYHSRDNLQIIEFDKLFNQTTQKDTTFSLPLATTGNFYDFVTVIAVNKNGIMGPPSSELG